MQLTQSRVADSRVAQRSRLAESTVVESRVAQRIMRVTLVAPRIVNDVSDEDQS